MREVEAALESRWALQIKPSSREYIVPRGSPHTSRDRCFKRVELLSVLGHTVASDSSYRPDWAKARAAMWRAFYRCCASKAAKKLPWPKKQALLRKAVRPVLDFYNTRWALTAQLLSEVDRAQRRMVAILLGTRKEPGETPEGFVRRRGRQAGQVAARDGLWSERCAKRVIAWHDHLQRERNHHAWPAQLLKWHGEEWLQQRRAMQNSASVFAGRTATRLSAGKVQCRWHDGVATARARLRVEAASSANAARSEMAKTRHFLS